MSSFLTYYVYAENIEVAVLRDLSINEFVKKVTELENKYGKLTIDYKED